MKKFLPIYLIPFLFLPFLNAQPAVGTWTSQDGAFPAGAWQEVLYGGGEGRPGNEIQAWSDSYYALTGATILSPEDVVQLQTCAPAGEGEETVYPAFIYETIYSGGLLELANAGTPWESADPSGTFTVALGPLTNRTTKFTAENSCDQTGVISFDLAGVGTIEGHEGYRVFVNAHYTGTPSVEGTDPAVLSDSFEETGFVSLSISPPAVLDIKPGSCLNPFNVRARGVLPVALFGSDLVDATSIDPSTLLIQSFVVVSHTDPTGSVPIYIEGISPLRWAWEDVSGPEECGYEAPDGLMDLVVKFSAQEISAALGDYVADGDEVLLTVTADLDLTDDGGGVVSVPLVAQDLITILDKGRKTSGNPGVGTPRSGERPGNPGSNVNSNRNGGDSGSKSDDTSGSADNANRGNRSGPRGSQGRNGGGNGNP